MWKGRPLGRWPGSIARFCVRCGPPLPTTAEDLAARTFPVNMCTRTMLGKAEVVLWRTATQRFRIEVWRSFAAYVSAFLAEAALGIG